MKKLTLIGLAVLASTVAFGQALDISAFKSLTAPQKDGVQSLTDGLQGGLSSLEWTDGSGPTLFRISVGVYAGLGSYEEAKSVGIDKAGMIPSAGLQVGLGTLGAEGYFRMLPSLTFGDASIGSMGFGLKYDLTDLIPVTGFPSTSAYVGYGTINAKFETTVKEVEDNSTGTTIVIPVNKKVSAEIKSSTFNLGVISSYDLVILRVFARAAFEAGNSDLDWAGFEPVKNGQSFSFGEWKSNESFGNSGMRLGIGLSLIGIKAEIGVRNGLYAGAGYGFSF
ncbi:MAG: hypothetical protein LCH54_05725 [Bacteroidetes bacterium]|nr:hypothetical protein [Bacteroidota bacterium]